jgi:hypothetical protein
MFRPAFLGHHQVVQTSLKSIVHEFKIIYCDDEISFILQRLVNILGVKVVRLVGSRSWVWGGGGGWDSVVSYCGFFSISCSASSLLYFLVGVCYNSGVWMNLAVCLFHSVRRKKNTKCGIV